MKVDPTRMLSARDFRTSLSYALDQAQDGATTHITRDGRIHAHLVAPHALVHDGNELSVMMNAALESEARWLANQVQASGFTQAGDAIGMVFGWLWQCDYAAAVQWLAHYGDAVTLEFEARGWMRPAFGPLWRALSAALKVRLSEAEVTDFAAAARAHLADWPNPFTAAELAGGERHRHANDPWPDATEHDVGWAKKRWRDITAATFVPDPRNGFKLRAGNDGWCRVVRLNGSGEPVTLGAVDGTEFAFTYPGDESWVPFQERAPYRWGVQI